MSGSKIRIGDQAPELELVTVDGEPVPLQRAWDRGPGLLVFPRHLG